MRDYFSLQWTILLRTLKEAGFPPLLAFPFFSAAFVALSAYLFYRTEFAPYIYVFLAISLIFRLSERRRNEFLRINFSKATYRQLRIIENIFVTLPFIGFLVFKTQFLFAALLLLVSVLLAFSSVNTRLHMVVPTPFGRKPFEFAVGFRSTFFLFPIAYALAVIAVAVDNFNLGAFAVAFVFLVSLAYYAKPENEYYVWIFKHTPQQFLLEKIKTALLHASLVVLPVAIFMSAAYPSNMQYLLLILCFGYLFLTCMVVAKYSSYPYEIGIPQSILIGVSAVFPPLLLLTIPLFFRQSVSRLKTYLHD